MIELAVYPCGQVICNRRGFLMQRSFMFLARFASIRKCATNVLMTRNHRVSDTIEPADTIEDLCCNAPGLLLVASKLLRKAGNDTKVLTSKCASVMEFGNAPCVYVVVNGFGCSTHSCPHFMQTTTCLTLLANIYMSELSCTSDSTADQRVLICWQIWTCHYWFRYFCLLSLNSTAGQRTSKQQTCFWRATTVGLTRLSLLTSSTWFPVAMKPWCRELHPNVRFRDSFKATIATSGGSYDTKPPCSWHERATVFMTRKTNCNPCFWHDHILSMKPMILSMYCLCYMLLTWNFLCFCHTSMNVFMTREENRDSDTTSYSRLNWFKSNVLLSLFMLKTTNTFLTRDHKRVSDTTYTNVFLPQKINFSSDTKLSTVFNSNAHSRLKACNC